MLKYKPIQNCRRPRSPAPEKARNTNHVDTNFCINHLYKTYLVNNAFWSLLGAFISGERGLKARLGIGYKSYSNRF